MSILGLYGDRVYLSRAARKRNAMRYNWSLCIIDGHRFRATHSHSFLRYGRLNPSLAFRSLFLFNPNSTGQRFSSSCALAMLIYRLLLLIRLIFGMNRTNITLDSDANGKFKCVVWEMVIQTTSLQTSFWKKQKKKKRMFAVSRIYCKFRFAHIVLALSLAFTIPSIHINMFYETKSFGWTECTRREYNSCVRRAVIRIAISGNRANGVGEHRIGEIEIRSTRSRYAMHVHVDCPEMCVRAFDGHDARIVLCIPVLEQCETETNKSNGICPLPIILRLCCVYALLRRQPTRRNPLCSSLASCRFFHLMRAVFVYSHEPYEPSANNWTCLGSHWLYLDSMLKNFVFYFLFAHSEDEGTLTCVWRDAMIFGIFLDVWKCLRIEQLTTK